MLWKMMQDMDMVFVEEFHAFIEMYEPIGWTFSASCQKLDDKIFGELPEKALRNLKASTAIVLIASFKQHCMMCAGTSMLSNSAAKHGTLSANAIRLILE